jgi:hypothetical protein
MAYKLTRKDFGLTAGVVVALLWLAFVWPTPWREYKLDDEHIRLNRFTGKTETLTMFGWQPVFYSTSPRYNYDGVWVDVPKLQKALETAGRDVVSDLNHIKYGLRYKRYPDALEALDKLMELPSLTDGQKQIVSEVIEQVKHVAKSQEAAK